MKSKYWVLALFVACLNFSLYSQEAEDQEKSVQLSETRIEVSEDEEVFADGHTVREDGVLEVNCPDEDAEILKVIKPLKWKKARNASLYKVQIDKEIKGKWVTVLDVDVKETFVELALSVGKYRISTVGYNSVGRQAQVKPNWKVKTVIADDQPYLYPNYLKKSKEYDTSVLMVTYTKDDDISSSVSSKTGDPENSFELKGKNVFFTNTRFYMEPVNEPTQGGKAYKAYNSQRVRVPLKVERNDHDKQSVVVSYDKDLFESGYYRIYAENPGRKTAYLDMLVFATRKPVFTVEKFTYYPNYEVRLLSLEQVKKDNNILKLFGMNFTEDTEYLLTPSTAGIPYPFASFHDREKISLTVNEMRTMTVSGEMEIDLNLDPNDVRPGYYNLSAQNKMGRESILLLVRDLDKEAKVPNIKSISSEADSDFITITLKGSGFTENVVYSIVSELSDETGTNIHIPLILVDLKRGGKKIVLQGRKEKLEEGTYGLLVETAEASFVRYFDLKKNMKSVMVSLTDEVVEEKFIRPENFVAVHRADTEKKIVPEQDFEISPFDFNVKRKSKKYFPYLTMDLSLAPDPFVDNNQFMIGASLGSAMVNLDWLRFGFNLNAYPTVNVYGADLYAHLATPTLYIRPFAGLGFGVNFFPLGEDIFQMYAFGRAGVVLFDFFDLKYGLYLNIDHNLENFFAYDMFSIGIRIPIKAPIYIQQPINYTLTITKSGVIDGAAYDLENIKKIVFAEGVTEISGFADMPILEQVVLPDSIKVIRAGAFANCPMLKKIDLPEGLETIQANAFKNDNKIISLDLPNSIRFVDDNAFAGWYSYQLITYNWNDEDNTKRYLGSLTANIPGNPKFVGRGTLITVPFSKSSMFQANAGGKAKSRRGIHYVRNGLRTNFGWNFTGQTAAEYDWISFTTEDKYSIEYLLASDGVCFKTQGDGKRYKISFYGPDYAYGYYAEFEAGLIAQEVKIPFSNFRVLEYTNVKPPVPLKQMPVQGISFELTYYRPPQKFNFYIWDFDQLNSGEK